MQGGHRGQTAPCSIAKTYTAYEDRDLGDGCRGSSLWGGAQGFACDVLGHCTGRMQAQPVHLLGTDSHGCCCSAGSVGLGLVMNQDSWNPLDTMRYAECDSQLYRCQQANENAQPICKVEPPCAPEVCQFEIVETPHKGTLFAFKDDTTAGDVIANCTNDVPCVVPMRFNAEQPVLNNLVGANGRFETNKVIFRPEPGDVGLCDAGSDPNCLNHGANSFWRPDRQSLFRYTEIKFQVRSFTWMYIIPEQQAGNTLKSISKEFARTNSNPYVEKIEDAYQKFLRDGVYQPFAVEACPCLRIGQSVTLFMCDNKQTTCDDEGDGMLGRLMIIDFKRLLGFDAGTATKCACTPNATTPATPPPRRCPGEEQACYLPEDLEAMIVEVKNGCAPGNCFQNFKSAGVADPGSTGQAYDLLRNQTGVSPKSQVWTRIIPYNDRPSVGGAGASLRFDGIDDVAAATVDAFPRDAFTVMFWIKGINSERKNQGILQFIAEDKGVQLQVYNSHNLEIFVLDESSGPTGVDVNFDLQWHHVAVTWTGAGQFMANDTYQGPGVAQLFIDCELYAYPFDPKAAQANAPGGQSEYKCKHAVNKEGWAWSGQLSRADSRMTSRGEVSIGQRMACNATTAAQQMELERAVNLAHNQTFCRRKVRHECDKAFNETPSIYHPGMYSPESDCTKTILGFYVSGGSVNVSTCAFNVSDPHGAIKYGPIQKQMALDWSFSNDGDPTSGSTTSPYTIPKVTQTQTQNFMQMTCSSGCYKSEHAFLGYLDELRVYNFTMTMREIAFRSKSTVRDGVNCDDVELPQNSGVPPIVGCSHMIDPIYKFGLTLFWPFDDPFPSYSADSLSFGGSLPALSITPPGFVSSLYSLMSYEYARVRQNKIGNYHSGIQHAMRLGAGRNSTAPMRVPSTAPVNGARYDFVLYARSQAQLVEFKLGDVDTCVNTEDILNMFADSYLTAPCDGASGCSDSHCNHIAVEVLSLGATCSPLCYGELFRPAVREECQHPESARICAAYPECIGDLCFETSGKISASNNKIDRFYTFTGEYIDEGDLAVQGRQGKCLCDGNVKCSPSTFSMNSDASGKPTGSLGSYTGFTVRIQDGSNVESRTVLCHGDSKCDPREGFPLPGRVITLDRPLSFSPTSESNYWIFKGKYQAKWLAYYKSDLIGGGGTDAELIKYDVYDMPGEAGTVFSKVSPVSSFQDLRFLSSLNPDAAGNAEISRWNQPQMQGNIIITALGVPIPMSYNVSVPEDTITLMSLDVILDDDNHHTDFNLTVNGPQEYDLAQQGLHHESGELSGDMFQVFDVHCGLVKKDSKCVTLKGDQIAYATGKSGEEEVTYCDDPTYIASDSLMEKLKRSYSLFNHGIISKVCTYNENATEIYNVTGYNYTCLPPCSPTLYTYQIIAVGCIENCSSGRSDLICDNTYGLYPDQFACIGGEFHGQACLSFDDVATCFSLTDQRASCNDRDLQPGIRGTDLKTLLDKTDPSVMLHAIQTGDIHFVDWVHRAVKAVWSELCTDLAAALGYELILRYLIKNGCPWRDSALEKANARGRVQIVQYLTALRPPNGRAVPTCGCPALQLHERTVGFRRCVPFSKSGFECYQKCGIAPTDDPSCQDGESNYLADDKTSTITFATEMGQFLMSDIGIPEFTRCSTGSKRALVRGPQIHFLSNQTDIPMRLFSGSYVGFSDKAIICEGDVGVFRGDAPRKKCKDPGTWPMFTKTGQLMDFLNFHVSDKDLRVLYIPAPGMSGFAATFNYTVSRMTQRPRQYKGAPFEGFPVAARTGTVTIFIDPSNDYPDPQVANASYLMREDEITVMKLHWSDSDTARKSVRVYISEFPKHGDLYQVVEAYKSLNKTFGFNYSAHLLDPNLCKTTAPNCLQGNCDQPKDNCYYLSETFVIGEPIPKEDVTFAQAPSSIYNTTRATISPLPVKNATQCFETDRYGGLDMDDWAGEVFCEMPYFDNIPTTCRRCMTVDKSTQTIPPGPWSGTLMYDPIYTQRQDGMKPVDAPNVLANGGLCSLQEQCRLGANTESKAACIDWRMLSPSGRPTVYNETPMVKLNETANSIFWTPWSWSHINLHKPYPCSGPSEDACTKNVQHYAWPGHYDPAHITPRYPPQPIKDSIPPYQNLSVTKYGDPVDTESFYSLCRDHDVHQFMAEYDQYVFMKGFDIHLSLPDGIFFRVLAWTSRFLTEDTYELFESENVTRTVREDRSDGPKPFVTFSFSKTKRMQKKRRLTKCAGEEWREVWRGFTEEGRPARSVAESTQEGRDIEHPNLRFRFHPTNFTTKKLLIQSCGLMYQSAHNGDPGNPLESLENLLLVGAVSKPKMLVSDSVDHRIAYVPHPHFTGEDSFSFYGDDSQQYCQKQECIDRKDLKIAEVKIKVMNTEDLPRPDWMEVTGGPGETIEFELNGIDASPDRANGWVEWFNLAPGAEEGKMGPPGGFKSYPIGLADSFGSQDREPDDGLAVVLETKPELGTLTSLGGRRFQYAPPANGGGKPIATLKFRLRDQQGKLSPNTGTVFINYICNPGHFVNQLQKICSPCPKGFFKPRKDDSTACFSCVTGKYAPTVALTACLNCAAGKYQYRPAASSCVRCRIGHFANQTGSERCLPCSPGTYAPRMNATACMHCGTLSYAPLPAMFRCYDCPRLSWSVVTDSSDVSNCRCTQGTYRNSIFNDSVRQLWSPDNLGKDNNSYVTPTVDIIREPWPERLQMFSSNCSACPDGSFCHGADLPPVARIGWWTDWKSDDKEFWENHVDAKFYRCDANNVREVCLGYPAIDIQEQNEMCRLRTNWGYCDDWPHNNYTKLPDASRCKSGYEDVVCSKCIGYELQQCVPKGSDSEDGWFSWKLFAQDRSRASYFRQPFIDCYAVGSCRPGDKKEECDKKRDTCKNNKDRCTWQTNRYYRAFDGTCSVCPMSALAGFIFYLAWFAIFCAVVLAILGLALTDMNSFSITFTFWQTAALLARYRIPWPQDAQSLLSLYSIANVNLDGIPWMCFFNSAPNFRDIWFLTNLSIGGLVAASIIRWVLPFLAVPPRGKVLIQQFKTAISRRDMLKGVGSVARVQYLHRRADSSEVRPSSVAPSQRSRRPSTAPHSRPSTGGSRLPGDRPVSALAGSSRSRGSSRHADDIVIVEEDIDVDQGQEQISGTHHGAAFGSPFTTRTSKPRLPASLSEESAGGPRSRASLFPAGSCEEERTGDLPGAIAGKSPKLALSCSNGSDMILEDVPEGYDEADAVSRKRKVVHAEKGSVRQREYNSGAIKVYGGAFGMDFSKMRSGTSRETAGTRPEAESSTTREAETEDRPGSAREVPDKQHAESKAKSTSVRPENDGDADVTSALQHPAASPATAKEQARLEKKDAKDDNDDTAVDAKDSGSKITSVGTLGTLSVFGKFRKAKDEAQTIITDKDANSPTNAKDKTAAKMREMKESGAKMFSMAKSAGETARLKAIEAKEKAAKIASESAAAVKELKDNPGVLKDKMKAKKSVFSFLSPSKGKDAEPKTGDKTASRPQSKTSTRSRPRSALRPPRAPDVLVLEDVEDLSALSRPISAVSRPWSAASGISRPESAKSVSFQNAPAGSRPSTGRSARRPRTPSGALGMGNFDDIAGRTTPSRVQREREGWREYRTDNPFQMHTPRMEQRLNSARSDGSSKEVPMDLGGIAWYVRKQYFDMAWRHAVAVLSILYIASCQKTLQALKWTYWTYSPVMKTAVLDYDPSVRLFDWHHGPVFPFALMVLPVTVGGPVVNFFMLYTGYKFRILDDTSFSMRWGYLLDPFERKYWYWSLIIATRKFVFVFAQTFLRNRLYVQKFFPALVICINVILNYSLRPYRVERHNVYENILLVCLLFLLLLGLISPLDITVYHDAVGKNLPGPYDNIIVFGVLLIGGVALLVSLVVIYADILDAQLRTPRLIKVIYLLTLGPVEMVLRIVHNILELLFGTLWWVLGKIGIRKKEKEPDSEDTPTSSARLRLKKKKQQSKYMNPQALNRGSGDPPHVTGDRYADILWEKVFGVYRSKKKVKLLNTLEDDYDELVRPDDGAKWLRDKFSIRKRIFLIERRLQREALYDPKNTTILRMERQLTVAIDAALAQLKRERDTYFDQLYDSQTEYEAICADRDVAQNKLDEQQKSLIETEDAANFARARLDATFRRTGQPEDWKKRFLEAQVLSAMLEHGVGVLIRTHLCVGCISLTDLCVI